MSPRDAPGGRGVEQLLRRFTPEAAEDAVRFMVRPSRVELPPWHPPESLDEEYMAGFTDAVLARGKSRFEPLVARRIGEDRYQLVAGAPWLEAARRIGYETIPVLVVDVDEPTAMAMTFTDTLAREGLSTWEEAQGLAELAETLGEHGQDAGAEKLATLTGHSPDWVRDRIRVAGTLTPDVLQRAGLTIHDLNVIPEPLLVDIARRGSPEERARELRSAHDRAAAEREPRAADSAGFPDGAGYSLQEISGGRIRLEIRRPPDAMDPAEAGELLRRLEPIVEALRRAAKAP